MNFESIIRHSAQLFVIADKSKGPADEMIAGYLRKKKYIGSKERRFISDLVYSVFRLKKLLQYSSNDNSYFIPKNDEQYAELLLVTCCAISVDFPDGEMPFDFEFHLKSNPNSNAFDSIDLLSETATKIFNLDSFQAKRFIEHLKSKFRDLFFRNVPLKNDDIELLSNKYSMPDWIIDVLLNNTKYNYDIIELEKNLRSNLYPAPVSIRVNTRFISVRQAINEFNSNGLICTNSPLSPSGITFKDRYQLKNTNLYKLGAFEVQDIGSQMISIALDPQKRESILDACAGAGGKTLHIADLQSDTGIITACDIDFMKLRSLSNRAEKSNIKSIKTLLIDRNLESNQLQGSLFDRVLIDAPCSGTGTFRRNPAQKWRLTMGIITKHAAKQLKLLKYYSNFVKPGGILVYSTCSILPLENEVVVEEFLRSTVEFVPDSIGPVFSRIGLPEKLCNSEKYYMTLNTSEWNTDGFFICRLKRVV